MNKHVGRSPVLSRRLLLQVAGTIALSSGSYQSAGAQVRRYHRTNVNGAAGKKALAAYKKAIRAMLALPPSDPRNWYRIALVHVLDCPHGNWWFLPWHRGYLGWFEQACREFSGDADFALPYWDWTADPRIPSDMFDDVLTPTSPEYIDSFAEFKKRFDPVVSNLDCWKVVMTPEGKFDYNSAYGQLLTRGIRTPADLWFDIFEDPRQKLFFDLAHARDLTKDKPDLDAKTKKLVSLSMLNASLKPEDFVTFASPKGPSHGILTGYGVLESQPHMSVHVAIGGFMQQNLAPVDPIFWLHHANIDRIWDVWERRQSANKKPHLPDGAPTKPGDKPAPQSEYEWWAVEPFLFFTDAKGNPVQKTTCGDYAEIGEFDYDYEPGEPEKVPFALASAGSVQTFSAQILDSAIGANRSARATVNLPSKLLDAAPPNDQAKLFARVVVVFRGSAHAMPLRLSVGSDGAGPDAPGFAGVLAIFGHQGAHGPVSFLVPLPAPLRTLRANRALAVDAPLGLTIAQLGGAAHMDNSTTARSAAEVLSMTLEVH